MPRTKRAANALLQFWIDEDTATEKLGALNRMLSPPGLVGFMRKEVEPHLRQRARARFANEGDEVVGNWLPLKESTQSFRESEGFFPDHPINERTGELLGFITRGLNELNFNANSATLFMPGRGGNRYLKAKVGAAQRGKSWTPVTPARPVLALGTNDLVHVLNRLALYITEGIAHDQHMGIAHEPWGTPV